MKLPNEIWINTNGGSKLVLTTAYIQAKTADLKESGYNSVTEDGVEQQLYKILNGEQLNIIGKFMEADIIKLESYK